MKLSVNDWDYPARRKSKVWRYGDSQIQALPLRLLANTNNSSYFVYAGVVRLHAAIVTVSARSATEPSASSDLHLKKVWNGRNVKVPQHVQLLWKRGWSQPQKGRFFSKRKEGTSWIATASQLPCSLSFDGPMRLAPRLSPHRINAALIFLSQFRNVALFEQ